MNTNKMVKTFQAAIRFCMDEKELRQNEDWKRAQREYIEMICDLGDAILEEQEDTGERQPGTLFFLSERS